jgi:hypothetical protein
MTWVKVSSHRSREYMTRTLGHRPQAYGLAPKNYEYVGNAGEYYQVPDETVPQLTRIKGLSFPKRLDVERLRKYW